MADFISGFWNMYVMVLVALSILFCVFVLASNMTKREKGPVQLHGHVWDETLAEYNNPLPRWWMYLFWITIVFAVVYLAIYPGFGRSNQSRGQWAQYDAEMQAAQERFGPVFAKYREMDVMAVAADPEANAMGKRLFLTYCAQCHGSDAKGAKGFPNLADADWLYGGAPDKIIETITEGRRGQMPVMAAAVGGPEDVRNVANYVLSLSGSGHNSIKAELGREKFKQACAACHGADGKGTQALGAPNLSDKTWLHGFGEDGILSMVNNGKLNIMPAQKDRLSADQIKLVASYVWGLSNTQKTAEAK